MENQNFQINSNEEVKITYETLFEMFRNEKSKDILQELSPCFFIELLGYLKEKQRIIDEFKNKSDLFSSAEREKTNSQLQNVKKLVKELYQRREKKIIDLALNKSRTNSDIIDTTNVLKEEQMFYDDLLKLFNRFREGIVTNLINLKDPKLEQEKVEEAAQIDGKPKSDNKMIIFSKPVQRFVGPDLQVYGPFTPEDMAKLPNELADVLIEKGVAEEMETE